MHICPKCKNGKWAYTVHSKGKVTEHEMKCIWCGGEGQLSYEGILAIKAEELMWCKCENKSDVRYYDDHEHPNLSKHHYRCVSCDGVVQIG